MAESKKLSFQDYVTAAWRAKQWNDLVESVSGAPSHQNSADDYLKAEQDFVEWQAGKSGDRRQ